MAFCDNKLGNFIYYLKEALLQRDENEPKKGHTFLREIRTKIFFSNLSLFQYALQLHPR